MESSVGEDGQDLKAGNELLSDYGIRIFTWGADTMAEAADAAGSSQYDEMIPELSKAMEGMQDITLLGLSKGGQLILQYLSSLAEGRQLTQPIHAVLVAAADTPFAALLTRGWGTSPYFGVPYNPGIDVANVCSGIDPLCTKRLEGARNFEAGSGGILGHGIHGELAGRVLMALNVMYDHGAWGYRVGR